jgi:hypothetical protein
MLGASPVESELSSALVELSVLASVVLGSVVSLSSAELLSLGLSELLSLVVAALLSLVVVALLSPLAGPSSPPHPMKQQTTTAQRLEVMFMM